MLTLLRQGSSLAEPRKQVAFLESGRDGAIPAFGSTLAEHKTPPLRAASLRILQINVGKLCNQTCSHCHVDAGPDRRESMTREIADACLSVLRAEPEVETLDITGGAPEMNPQFRHLVTEARALGKHVIDRCNLTILTAPGFTDLPEFLAEQQVEVVASLPCYLEENCDRQRGDGVFKKSIQALQRLNELGYGQPGTDLSLTLVYNPVGSDLPPSQETLEAAYREQLRSRFGVEFNQLFTITNMPISRFLDDLIENGQYDAYMHKLLDAFNPAAAQDVMCRSTLSVDWEGNLYDCDFNQMLELPVASGSPRHISDFDGASLRDREIVTGRHCYGCTAGDGSSCQGSLVSSTEV